MLCYVFEKFDSAPRTLGSLVWLLSREKKSWREEGTRAERC